MDKQDIKKGGIWKKDSIYSKLASICPIPASKRAIPTSKNPILESNPTF
jgi:hypothetical protein